MSNGGIVGALGRLKNRADQGVANATFDPLMWIVRLVLIAGAILVYKKASANPDPTDVAFVGLTGMAALMTEYYMGGEMVRAWFDRSMTRIFATSNVFAVAFVFQCLSWAGTASESEANKSGLQKSAFIAASTAESDMKAASVAAAGQVKVVEALKVERWRPLPTIDGKVVGSAKEAATVLATIKGNTRFWTITEGCTKSAGPQTREYVKTCGEAQAAISASETREQIAPTLKEAEARLADLQAAYLAAKTKYETAPKGSAAVSESRNDLRFLVSYAGMSEQQAMDFSAAWKIMIISVLAVALGMMCKSREYRDLPRKPWPLMTWLKHTWSGAPTLEDDIRAKLATTDGKIEFSDAKHVEELRKRLALAFEPEKKAS